MKSFTHYMRILHRDIGFFLIGLTVAYSISGILLIYRDTNFLKQEKTFEKQISANLNENQIQNELRLRNVKVSSYNSETGTVIYTSNELPNMFNKIIQIHKSSSKNPYHWINLLFGSSLLFMSISGILMFNIKSNNFKRGLIISSIGLISLFIILLL